MTMLPQASALTPGQIDCCAADGCDASGQPPDDALRVAARRRVRALSGFSLLWMTGEGVTGLWAGLSAHSVALVAWALGSVIEGVASVAVIWRFSGMRVDDGLAERRSQRAVAVSFWLLAPLVAAEALHALLRHAEPQSSPLGIAVTAASLLLMPGLAHAKARAAIVLGSKATAGEARQNLLCAGQACAVLLGLVTNALVGVGWLDPVIAIGLAGWAVREGAAAWRGQSCC
jgi:divalent metal cation (Fe/Co/Zn/Cd) transporter